MSTYFGREQEKREFQAILAKKTSSLVTCQGRRRIGKSRFIRECAAEADSFFEFSGLPPRSGLTKQDQLAVFADQLAKQSKAPRLILDSWATAFQLLASQLPTKGTAVILLDEVSWMGIGAPDFAGYIKNAWDQHFSRRAKTVVVLCGSVSSWIEENILNNTGFVGRCSWQFHLQPLALHECEQFCTDLSGTAARGVTYDLRRLANSADGQWQLFCHDPNGARVELDFDASEAAPA